MKKFLCVAGISIFVYACQSDAPKQEETQAPDSISMVPTDTMIQVTDTAIMPVLVESWKTFEGYDSKYAADVKLLDQKPLKERLQKLLGKEVKDFTERYKVTPPIVVDGGVLFNEGCRPHDCTIEEAALAIDMKQDLIYIGIARKKVITLYGERGDTAWPQALREWKKKFEAGIE